MMEKATSILTLLKKLNSTIFIYIQLQKDIKFMEMGKKINMQSQLIDSRIMERLFNAY